VSPRPPGFGVVSLAALDLRRGPAHESELRSQLLLGEVVRVSSSSADRLWWRVTNESDGYSGWVRNWGIVGASRGRVARWKRRARARVRVSHAEARTLPGGGALVSPLFWNSRMIAGPSRPPWRRVELPDGRRGWVALRAISVGARRKPPRLTERIRQLLGVPYLWGGRTPSGLDCSALTQQVLGEQGFCLPRDARQQFAAARPLRTGQTPLEGDLAFFGRPGKPPGHVGLMLGGGYYVHARGRVRVNSVDPSNQLYDKEFMSQLLGYRRPLRVPLRRPAGSRRG
jgi:cell wall-associated NlpC family hydrolase